MTPNFFRREYGQLVAALVRRYGAHRLADIEDAVQFALVQALHHWRKDEVPDKPGAWLMRTAQRKLIDKLRRETRFTHDADAVDDLPQSGSEPAARLKQEMNSDLLRMLFVCCDPELSPQTQMVLALKTLCGFSTQEIALRLFLSQAAVQKRLSRGRSALRERWQDQPSQITQPALPHQDLQARTPALLGVVYLLFNEGYSSIRGDEPIRRGLCDEAIFLGHALLAQEGPHLASAQALLALMLFHRARFDARQTPSGKIVLLEDQDRDCWDRAMIQTGLSHFNQAIQSDDFSRYHGEAAVALQHCIAPSFDQTNWSEIADMYAILAKLIPSPIYILNRAIAVGQLEGPNAGIAVLQDTALPQWLGRYYLWDATIGELYRRAGDLRAAAGMLSRALEQAPQGWERELIAARLQACQASPD